MPSYPCNHCTQRFARQDVLNMHVGNVHGKLKAQLSAPSRNSIHSSSNFFATVLASPPEDEEGREDIGSRKKRKRKERETSESPDLASHRTLGMLLSHLM